MAPREPSAGAFRPLVLQVVVLLAAAAPARAYISITSFRSTGTPSASAPATAHEGFIQVRSTAAAAAARMTAAASATDEACDLDEPSTLCAYDPQDIDARFADEPLAVVGRIADVLAAFARVKLADDGGPCGLSSAPGSRLLQGGSDSATRPDIIGLETSRNLGQLQDAMAPESSAPRRDGNLAESLGGDYSSRLVDISPEPVAAASLAEVYRATTADGTPVAVKIQRPGLERKVALDLHVMRRLLALAQAQFKIGGNVDVVVAVLDEVGAGLFAELDFETEAAHIDRFRALYGRRLTQLGVVVPTVRRDLTSTRVLVTEWLDGVPPRELPPRSGKTSRSGRCAASQCS